MPTVVMQRWEEVEKDWGVRPDGISLHVSEGDRKAFIKDYWDSMPDVRPSEYSSPLGQSELLDVDDYTHAEIRATKNGKRMYGGYKGLR